MEKQIAVAKQNGNSVEIYDTEGQYLFSRTGTLIGFTATTVAIKDNQSISVYDANGAYLFSR